MATTPRPGPARSRPAHARPPAPPPRPRPLPILPTLGVHLGNKHRQKEKKKLLPPLLPPRPRAPVLLPSLGVRFEEEEKKQLPPLARPVALAAASAALLAGVASAIASSTFTSPDVVTTAAALGAAVGATHGGLASLAATTAWAAPPRPLAVLIVGGSRGLGRALAREFAVRGDAVVLTSRSARAARATAAELAAEVQKENRNSSSNNIGRSGPITGLACDVTKPASVAVALRAAQTALGGRLDVAVCSAGIVPPGGPRPLADVRLADVSATIATNLSGVAACCGAGVAAMAAQTPPGGHIFVVDGAGAGGRAVPGFAAYGAAKAGVASLARSLAAELAAASPPVPVGVHTLSPGMVLTPLLLEGASAATKRTAFGVFAEQPETVAAFLVPRARSVVARGGPRSAAIRLLTPATAASKVVAYALGRRPPYFDDDGAPLYPPSPADRLASPAGRDAAGRAGARGRGLAVSYALAMAGGLLLAVGGWV